MRILRPFPALAALALAAALALSGHAPALAQDPALPMGCGTSGESGQPITSVTSTETSISLTFSSSVADFYSPHGGPQICNSEGTTAFLDHKNAPSTFRGDTRTYSKFGTDDSAPALTAGSDYWVRWQAYGDGQPWLYIRTEGGASVSLSLNSAGDDDTYGRGDAIEITATFGESVTVTGTPRIPFTLGTATKYATYSSGSPGTELVFSYTVVRSDTDSDGIAIAANALELNGGTINLTSGGTAAAIDHGAVAASASHKVGGGDPPDKPAAPTVSRASNTSVTVTWTAPADNGAAIAGYDVQYRRHNQPGVADGAWTDATHTGTTASATISGLVRGASYEVRVRARNVNGAGSWSDAGEGHTGPARFASAATSGTGRAVILTFTKTIDQAGPNNLYTVNVNGTARQPFHVSWGDGKVTLGLNAANAIRKGDTVTVSYGKPTTGQILLDDDGQEVASFANRAVANNVASVAIGLNSAGDDNTYGRDDVIEVTATFPQSVTVTGAPRIPFTLGTATKYLTYSSGSPGTALVFKYTVVSADSDTDGIAIAKDALQLNGGTIKLTADGNTNAPLDHAAIATSSFHKVDGSLVPGPTVTIAGGTSPVTEGTAATFTLTADSAPTSDLTVNLTVADATGSDFVASGNEGSKTVTISSGSTTATYSVPTVGDSTDEANGAVTVTVETGTGYTVGTTASASVTVNDDDALAALSVDDQTVDEDAGTATFTVTLSPASGKTVTVRFRTSPGTALAPGDYTHVDTTLTFAPGDTSKTVAVTIVDDTDRESQEQYFVNLDNVANATLADGQGSGFITANDNSAPAVANAIPNKTAQAGAAFSFQFAANTFSDADSDTLTYTATKADGTDLPSWLTFTAGTRTFSGTPQSTDAGTLSVKVTASDGHGGAGTDTFDILVNRAPTVANAIPNQVATVNTAFSYTFPANTFNDADGHTLTYTATKSDGTTLPAWLSFSTNTRTFSGTPAPASRGTLSVKVTASDGRGGSVSDTFDLRVNTLPTLAIEIPDRTATVNAAFNYIVASNHFTDADGDTLTYTATKSDGTDLPSWLTFTANTRTFSGTPQSSDAGVLSVKVTASDGVASVSDSFNISVGDPSRAPTLANAIPDQTATTGTAFSYAFPANTFSAAAGDTLTYRATKSDGTALPSWLTFTASTRAFSGTPQSTDTGTLSVNVTARNHNGSVIDEFNIVVSANRAPTLANAIPDQTATTGTAFSYAFPANTFSDAEGDTLTYTVTKSDGTALPSWLSFTSSTRTFSGTPQSTDTGTVSVKVTASDGNGNTVSDEFNIVVSTNHAPIVATAIPNQTATVGSAFSYAFPANTFTDADKDTLTYTAAKSDGTALPAWLTFTASTRTFSGTPTAAGTVSVKVTASDGSLSVSDEFDIVVSAAKTVPMGCGSASLTSQAISSVSSTATSITVVFKSGTGNFHGGAGGLQVCNSGGSTAWLEGTGFDLTNPVGQTKTYSKFGQGDSAPALTSASDYWVRWVGYGSGQPWIYIRTASAGPTITIAAGTSPVTEGTSADFTLTADSAPSADLTVNLTVADADGSDFVAAANEGAKTATISSGSTTATYSVATEGDTTDEPNGSVTVTVGTGTGYSVGTTASASVTVNDDDDPPAPTVSSLAITSDPGGDLTYTGGDQIQVTLTFSEAVTVTGTPRLKLRLRSAHTQPNQLKNLDYASGSGTTKLVFSYTVHSANNSGGEGVEIVANTLELNSGTIKSTSGSVDATLTHTGLSADTDHKVAPGTGNTTKPTVSGATVAGTTLTITFNETLDTRPSAKPAASAFTVKEGTTAQTVSSVAVSGMTVTLTLATAVSGTSAVTVSYTKPAANALQDNDGANDVASFIDQAVNSTPIVANAIPDRPATVGTAFTYAFPANTFSDADGTTLTYTAAKSDGTALPGWLTFTDSTRTFSGTPAATDTGTVTVKVTASDGTLSVSDEFVITVSVYSGPLVTISGGSAVTEGTAASFTVTSTVAPSADLTVNLTVADATGSDFVAAADEGSKTVTIASGSTSATYTVSTQSDTTDEDNGSVTVTVDSGTGYRPGTTASASVTVNDDDALASLSVDDQTVNEGDGEAVFTVTLSPASGKTVTVRFYTTPGTITASSDYTAVSKTLTFMPGETSKTVSVPVIDDTLTENTEQGWANLDTETNADIGDDQGNFYITDNDSAGLPSAPGAPGVSATSGSTTSLDVSWSAPADNGSAITDYDVRYKLSSDTAWTSHAHTGTATSATIAGLTAGSAYDVQVRATNGNGTGSWSPPGSSSTNTASNSAPTVATAIPDQTAATGTAFSYAFPANTFSDADGTTLTYTAAQSDGTDLPTWLTFTASTRTFSGTPAATDAGTLSVKVTASDGSLSVSNVFAIVVRAPNNAATGAPAISGFPQVGQTLTAGTGGIADTDGLTGVTYTYQWNPRRRDDGDRHLWRDLEHLHAGGGGLGQEGEGQGELHRRRGLRGGADQHGDGDGGGAGGGLHVGERLVRDVDGGRGPEDERRRQGVLRFRQQRRPRPVRHDLRQSQRHGLHAQRRRLRGRERPVGDEGRQEQAPPDPGQGPAVGPPREAHPEGGHALLHPEQRDQGRQPQHDRPQLPLDGQRDDPRLRRGPAGAGRDPRLQQRADGGDRDPGSDGGAGDGVQLRVPGEHVQRRRHRRHALLHRGAVRRRGPAVLADVHRGHADLLGHAHGLGHRHGDGQGDGQRHGRRLDQRHLQHRGEHAHGAVRGVLHHADLAGRPDGGSHDDHHQGHRELDQQLAQVPALHGRLDLDHQQFQHQHELQHAHLHGPDRGHAVLGAAQRRLLQPVGVEGGPHAARQQGAGGGERDPEPGRDDGDGLQLHLPGEHVQRRGWRHADLHGDEDRRHGAAGLAELRCDHADLLGHAGGRRHRHADGEGDGNGRRRLGQRRVRHRGERAGADGGESRDHVRPGRRPHLHRRRQDPGHADLQRVGDGDRHAAPEAPASVRAHGGEPAQEPRLRERQSRHEAGVLLHGGEPERFGRPGCRGGGEHAGVEQRHDQVDGVERRCEPGAHGPQRRHRPQGGAGDGGHDGADGVGRDGGRDRARDHVQRDPGRAGLGQAGDERVHGEAGDDGADRLDGGGLGLNGDADAGHGGVGHRRGDGELHEAGGERAAGQ